ncbi:TonB-dependent receptor [Echinicola pacifica]|uniref:TonB-dependent receptor n=1 Tax=Echinicola pacifica TaxID=346377 RepID=A0A918Q8M3_9BACT|nr:outer membrane beta-barrel family protein [Echinicola pacifica]GGZ34793.1 TonB-dependent receptor [Echinicola pacifica]
MKIPHQLCIAIFSFFLLSAETLAEQGAKISGTVIDGSGQAIPFANISLLEASSERLITGVVSDEQGEFLLETSASPKLIVRVSTLGFSVYQSDTFQLLPGNHKKMGAIQLEEEATALEEVEVRASRPEVTIEADKTVVNIEGTVMAEGSNALDVVGRSPGVYVDSDGNINLNGRSGVVVMIDDRQTYMSAKELANFLRSMPADNIKSLEVINSPSAKYDAEGAAGIINIRLKKNDSDGINGNLQMGNYYNGRHAPFVGGSLNVRKGKWTTNASLNYNSWVRNADLSIIRRFQLENGPSVFDQDALLKMGGNNVFFTGGADYQINEKHSVGATFQANDYNGKDDNTSLTTVTNPDNQDINYLSSLNDNSNTNKRFFTNIHYIGNLDTLGTKLSADFDYTAVDGGGLSTLSNRNWVNEDLTGGTYGQILTDNNMNYTILTAKADFTKPLSEKATLEAGLKGSWVESDNQLMISKSEEDGPFVPDANSNHFIYNEDVLAAYTSLKAPINKTFNFQAGLRLEYSNITGNSVTLEQVNKQKYVNLFPSLFLQQKVSDKYSINYTLNRRITRPNYRMLNPFVFYIDPLTVEEGNPYLKPQYSTNFEMSHVINNAFQFTLAYSRNIDSFGQVMMQDDETRKTVLQVQNFEKSDDLSLRIMAPLEIAEWYSTSNMLQVYYKSYQSQLGEDFLDISQVSYMARTQHNITLPKGFKIEVAALYLSPFLEGQLELDGFGWVDAGITKSFKDDKFSLTLNGDDIFRTREVTGQVEFGDINTQIRQYNNQQAVRLTFNWKFSKGEKFKVSNRSGSTEERNRLD